MNIIEKYEKLGHKITTGWKNENKVRSINFDFKPFRELSSSDIWVDVLNTEGEFLGACCANISRVRDILFKVIREDKMIDMEDLYEAYCLLEDHDCFDGEEDYPINELKKLWLLVEPDADLSNMRVHACDPNNIEDAISLLAQGCLHIKFGRFFENHPYEHIKAQKQLTLQKIIPAIKTLHDKIEELDETVEAYALTKNDQYVENDTGLLLMKTEKIIQEMIGHLAEENPEEKFGYKKIKVSLKKGIENND